MGSVLEHQAEIFSLVVVIVQVIESGISGVGPITYKVNNIINKIMFLLLQAL